MRKEIVIAPDILIDKIKNNTLCKYFCDYLKRGFHLYITFGVRRKVEESLTTEPETKQWHKSLKEGLQQRLIVKSRHKYRLSHEFKKFYRTLQSRDNNISLVERELIALAFQEGIEIETNDERIIHILSEVKSNPRYQKYILKLYSHNYSAREA